MKTIHVREGLTAKIPQHMRGVRITAEMLEEKGACDGGVEAFREAFPSGVSYKKLRRAVAEKGNVDYERFLLGAFGGDAATAGDGGTATAGYGGTATAGYGGTATAGYGGTATAGYGGTATVGYGGTATAGEGGTATAGDWGSATVGYGGTATAGYKGKATAGDGGTATVGYGGTATAGYGGTATAGYRGIIQIQFYSKGRRRILTGYIGEGGLLPDVAYRVEGGKFVKV